MTQNELKYLDPDKHEEFDRDEREICYLNQELNLTTLAKVLDGFQLRFHADLPEEIADEYDKYIIVMRQSLKATSTDVARLFSWDTGKTSDVSALGYPILYIAEDPNNG